jgi:hypothetical protein
MSKLKRILFLIPVTGFIIGFYDIYKALSYINKHGTVNGLNENNVFTDDKLIYTGMCINLLCSILIATVF